MASELIAVALTDVLSDGLSMVYSFFEPSEENRSLGTFMILDHIARARRLGLPYVYLGYWIEGSKKMDYKGRFLPQQRLAPSGWLRVDATAKCRPSRRIESRLTYESPSNPRKCAAASKHVSNSSFSSGSR